MVELNTVAIAEHVVYQKTEKPVEEVKKLIDELDLGPIKFKLMDSEEGDGWAREKVEAVERQYKRFLFLTAVTGRAIIPTKEIDSFWHQHILDTEKYAGDCQKTFGFFLHHFPYIGLRGEEDRELLERLFAETRSLYENLFGEGYGLDVRSDCENCGNCTSTCGVCSNSGHSGHCSPWVSCDSQRRIRPTVALMSSPSVF